MSYWDEDIIGRGTGGVIAASNGGEKVGVGEGEGRKGGLEMVEMRNGKVVLRERVVEVDIVEGSGEEGNGLRGVDGDEEGERGRERWLEFMVGKRGRGFD